ncbi:DgyrCDS8384 [Dimorphilus gyrociliatus]|uniref:DgyrCDS8384 n=1 Tax=Dimorphilus gyrociliatus TaxID=2664684 RepID=A0A7I8VUZ4_9ANNE|nr:DgyrCDS8384 [Dimorphilus gyrociliatus]
MPLVSSKYKHDEICSKAVKVGGGGVITSPFYPEQSSFKTLECMWKIIAEKNHQILLNVVDIDFGNYRCLEAYIDIYDEGLMLKDSRKRLCDKKKDIKEIRTRTGRAYVRLFINGSKVQHNEPIKGFKIVWTGVKSQITDYNENKCDGFLCKGVELCTPGDILCTYPKSYYCIDKSLRCNGVIHCGLDDNSDEDGCNTLLYCLLAGGAVIFIVFTISIATFRARQNRKMKSNLRNGKLNKKPDRSPIKAGTGYEQPPSYCFVSTSTSQYQKRSTVDTTVKANGDVFFSPAKKVRTVGPPPPRPGRGSNNYDCPEYQTLTKMKNDGTIAEVNESCTHSIV